MADLPRSVIDTLIAEAVGEGPEGMRRVAETIINRGAIRGLTLDQVVRQPHQYTGFFSPGPAARAAQRDPQVRTAAEAALRLALEPGDPTGGADHYFAPGTIGTPSWAGSMTPRGDYGGHRFYSSQPIPPGSIPNVVASRLDVTPPQTRNVPLPQPRPATRPQIPATTPSQPTSIASRAFPTNNVTPRLAPDMGTYQHNDRTMQPAQIVGGFGSLTPNATPSRSAPVRAAAPDPYRGIYPVQQQTRLPPLPPPSSAPPRPTLNQMRADTGQLRATPAQVAQVPASQGTRVATIPTNPRIGQAPSTRVVTPVPVSAPAPRPTGPAASRDTMAQTAAGQASAAQIAAMFNRPPATPAPVQAPAPRPIMTASIPGPNAPPKIGEERLPAGVYPAAPTGPAVGTSLSVVPPAINVPMPRPRPTVAPPLAPAPAMAGAPIPPRPIPTAPVQMTPAPAPVRPPVQIAQPIIAPAPATRPTLPVGWAADFGSTPSRGGSGARSLVGGSRGYSANGLTKSRR